MSGMQPKQINVLMAWAIVMLSATSIVQGQKTTSWYERGTVQYEKRLKLTLQNPLAVERQGEPVVIPMEAIRKVAPDFPGKAWVVVDPGVAPDSPCGIEVNGNDVPSQADDLDGDGKADELVMLPSLKGKESKTVYIYFTEKEVPQPLYPKKTQIVDFKRVNTNTLFAIESDVLAFRFNRTTPDAPGFIGDMLAKDRQFPDYNLHLYDVSPMGRWLLKLFSPPDQLGIGSVLVWQDGVWKMATGPNAPHAVTQAKILADGRVRSVGAIETTGWQVGNVIYDVQARCTMYAGQRWLRYDLTVTAKQGQGGQFAVGLMKLENEKTDIAAERGRLSLWGDLGKINVKGVGLAVLFQPGDVKAVEEAAGGRVIELKNSPTAAKPLGVTLYLSGGSQEEQTADPAKTSADQASRVRGECKSAKEFFDLHADLAQKVAAPITVAIGGLESNALSVVRQPFKGGDFFLANPSSKPSALPGELDLNLYGFDLAGGLKAGVKDVLVDVVNLDGSPLVFIRKTVGPLAVEKISLQAGAKNAGSGIPIEEVSGGEAGVLVSTGKAKWLVTGNGLRKIVINGKEMALEQGQVSGAVKVIHNGEVMAIVRVGGDKEYTDYYFFKGTAIIRVVANHTTGFRSKEARSYVGKKELGVAGCERETVGSWGQWSSDSVFDKVTVLHSAEWCALYSPDRKVGLMCYGSPSAPEIIVEKGGKFDSTLAAGRQRQELYLAPLEDIEEGEALWPVMSMPFVFAAQKEGFGCFEDRNGNGAQDTFHVTDRNGNKRPDFDGDRWAFDMGSDDALQMVLEFEAKPRLMKVFCDTVSGGPLHNNNLMAYFGGFPEKWYHTSPYPPFRPTLDGCLSAAELQQPFFVYEDITGKGLFFKGPVTEGGFIASGKVTAQQAGPGDIGSTTQAMYTCLDLDDDSDCDIYMLDGARPVGVAGGKQHDRWIDFLVFDLSDNNLEPLTVVNPYTGRAYQAHRYFSFLMQDNSKIYNCGFRDGDGPVCGAQNWPMAGTWDIDNDGVAEAHIFHEMQHTLGMDLAKRRSVKDDWVRERWNLQRDIYHEKQAIPINFALLADWDRPAGTYCREHQIPAETFPVNVYSDPYGNRLSVSADFLPDKWHGERLDCKTWPGGQWDYWPNNNWNSFIQKKYRFIATYFFLPGENNHSEHEGCWNSCFFNPSTRIEIDSDGTSSFCLYHSPILSALHCKGLEFGVQCMHGNEDYAKVMVPYMASVTALPTGFWGFPEKTCEYLIPRERCNDYSRTMRLKGKTFLYYLDKDRDGYADTYLLDDENTGYFDKRIWYDKAAGLLTLYDRGELAAFVKPLEFPEYRLELKNYETLTKLYNEGLKRPGLLRELKIENRQCQESGAEVVFNLGKEWLPQVVADVSHRIDKADPWKDFGASGLDTFGRVASESPITMTVLEKEWRRESLQTADVFIIFRPDIMPSEAELCALKSYVEDGGVVVLMVEMTAANELAPSRLIARSFGVAIGDKMALEILPSAKDPELPAKEAPGSTAGGLLEGAAPIFLEAREMTLPKEARIILEYQKTPVIAEIAAGKGRFFVVGSSLFANKFMCLAREMRVVAYKPGNQDVAAKFIRCLLGNRQLRLGDAAARKNEATLRISGKGGPVTVATQWPKVLAEVNGKQVQAEKTGAGLTIQVPGGDTSLKIRKHE